MTEKNPSSKLTLLEKADSYFEGKQQLILWMSLVLTAVFGLLLFEPKVSIGGDDSMYINRAYNFIYKNTFPTFQGPLYPMFLGMIIYLAGTKLILFKLISLLLLIGHQWFTFKLFRDHLSPFLLFVFFSLISTSAAILYYGSATYNEVFYLFLQSIFLYHFMTSFISQNDTSFDLKNDSPKIIASGFLLFLLAITKNIGLVAIIAVVFYFLFLKNWKMAIAFIIPFVVFMITFKIMKSTIWGVDNVQISGQLDDLMYKVPYKPDSGTEDVYGFLMRLVENSRVYLGYHFRNIFGLASDDVIRGNTFITLLIYALFIPGFFIFLKRSRFWFFFAVFCATSYGATFLILQTFWLQERLIIVFSPLLLAFLIQILYTLFKGRFKKYSTVLFLFFIIIIVANLSRSFVKIPAQIKVNNKYLSGDRYYGFPEDWIYYLQMTKWVSDNLPKDAYVACRKPGMAFVYSGGKDFYGIWNVPSDDPEVLYNRLKDAGVTHVIMASLRTNPDDPNSRIINTVRRYLSAINNAYPGRLTLVHQIGENWPTYLYELQ